MKFHNVSMSDFCQHFNLVLETLVKSQVLNLLAMNFFKATTLPLGNCAL